MQNIELIFNCWQKRRFLNDATQACTFLSLRMWCSFIYLLHGLTSAVWSLFLDANMLAA